MNWSSIDPWLFAAGLGFFLYGMQQLEAGVRNVGGHWLEHALRRFTGHPLAAIAVGIVSTAILQSSSLVGLMVLAFVGADVLKMRNAVGVILGSNLGTTFTGWLVTAIGFKLDLVQFALPMLALGTLGVVLLDRRPRLSGLSLLMLGLGLLLYGLGFMKNSVEAFASTLDLTALAGASASWFALTGFVFAAVVQSSSATMMVTLSALNAQLIDLHSAAAIMIGANLGTTITLMLGALRGSAASRQVALAHFLFNLFTAVVAFLLLLPWLDGGLAAAGIEDPLFGLVAFHSFFNMVGIVCFLPFIDAFSKFLEQRFVRQARGRSRYLGKTPPHVEAAAAAALEAETRAVLNGVFDLNRRCFKLDSHHRDDGPPSWLGPRRATYQEAYETLKQVEGEILDYARQTLAASESRDVAGRVQRLLETVREGVYAAKSIKDIRANLAEFRHVRQPEIVAYVRRLNEHERRFNAELVRLMGDVGRWGVNEALEDLARVDAEFNRGITEQFYRDEKAAALTDLQASTFLNVLREVESAHRALLRAVWALREAPAPDPSAA